MRGWQVQGLDLTGHEDAILRLDPRGALFLGCTISEETADRLRAGGALVFPTVPDVPFDPWRSQPLHPGRALRRSSDGYDRTTDAKVYAWTRSGGEPGSLKELLAQALHDSSIDDALEELLTGVASSVVMGGHAVTRDDPAYADAARLGAPPRRLRADRGRPAADPARWRRPTSVPGWPARPTSDARPCRSNDIAAVRVVPARRHRVGQVAVGACRRSRRLRSLTRHPHLALRPRAAERVQLGDREVLPQRHPRGRAARGVPGRHRLPSRGRGHRPGDLPGGMHELLRAGRRRWCRWCSWAADYWTRDAAGLAAGRVPGRRTTVRALPISSTTPARSGELLPGAERSSSASRDSRPRPVAAPTARAGGSP